MPSQVKLVDLPGGGKDNDGADKGRSAPSSSRPSRPSPKKSAASDTDLKSRLHTVFDRIADAAEARGDEELATVVREDRDVIAAGLVSLTRPFQALRTPLLFVLAVTEPVMAFSRIVRLMVGRVFVMRAERTAEKPPSDQSGH